MLIKKNIFWKKFFVVMWGGNSPTIPTPVFEWWDNIPHHNINNMATRINKANFPTVNLWVSSKCATKEGKTTSQRSMRRLCGKCSNQESLRLLKHTQERLESHSSLRMASKSTRLARRRKLWSASGNHWRSAPLMGLETIQLWAS